MKANPLKTMYGVATVLIATALVAHSWAGTNEHGVVVGYGGSDALDTGLLWIGSELSLGATLISLALATLAHRPPGASAYFKTRDGDLEVPYARLWTFHRAVRFCGGVGVATLLSLAIALRWNHNVHVSGFSFYSGLIGLLIAAVTSHLLAPERSRDPDPPKS